MMSDSISKKDSRIVNFGRDLSQQSLEGSNRILFDSVEFALGDESAVNFKDDLANSSSGKFGDGFRELVLNSASNCEEHHQSLVCNLCRCVVNGNFEGSLKFILEDWQSEIVTCWQQDSEVICSS